MRTFLAGIGALALASQVVAGVSTSTLDTDGEFLDALSNEGLTELWAAQGRIGNAANNGDQEFDIGYTTAAPVAQSQFAWANNQPIPFTLTYDAMADTLTWDVPGGPLVLNNAGAANELFIRVRATNQRPDLAVTLEALQLDGMGISDFGTNNDPLDGIEYLRISNQNLEDGFVLSGRARLNFDDGNPPSGSNLAWQIKGTVPTPGTIALAGLGGIAMTRRRR